uniref:Uncharacterized protein n=2 Tax=Oryza sativa subsp. japonica TaxID=39947 RepID=Q10D37_ORYSJ|nr:hypothetical protein [Oryza sativa Japonica Group]ABF98805.1 hypothetical protein LOC_Os03g53119 [Oryza sativa Japonica Group]
MANNQQPTTKKLGHVRSCNGLSTENLADVVRRRSIMESKQQQYNDR